MSENYSCAAAGSRSCQKARKTGGAAGADQSQNTEQTAGYGIVTAKDKWYNTVWDGNKKLEQVIKVIVYRKICNEDIENFWYFLNQLDMETNDMMYEPKEREQRANIQELKKDIQENVISGNDFLQIAVEDGKIVGYIRAERGRLNRIAHTAYIVIGILNAYTNQGIGSSFFRNLIEWAKKNRMVRLELTVECHNKAARHLYEKNGFQVEGVRRKSMFVDEHFVDEYYMALLL